MLNDSFPCFYVVQILKLCLKTSASLKHLTYSSVYLNMIQIVGVFYTQEQILSFTSIPFELFEFVASLFVFS